MYYAIRMVVLALPLGLLISSVQSQEAKDEKKTKILGSTAHPTGLVVEVTGLKYTPDGFLRVSWRYRNPKDKAIKAFAGSAPGTLVNQSDYWLMIRGTSYVDPSTKRKHPVLSVTGSKTPYEASTLFARGLIVEANDASPDCWAEFGAPDAKTKKIMLYIGGLDPIDEVPVPEKPKK